jgi:ureidoacrylate peracid hydrolase
MHDIDIPQWVVDRVVKHRGVEHVFTDLDPSKTALIVIDMQNAFMLPGVGFAEIKTAPEIVPNINGLETAVRSAGATVVWIAMTHTDDVDVDWTTYGALYTEEIDARRAQALTRGTKGREFVETLDVQPGEPVIEKTRFSALVQGSSELDAFLRARDIDTLLITGCLTDVCCESTGRDGMMLDYRVVMVTDANAADTDADHNAALCAFYTTFGDIMPTDMLVDLLAGS